MTWAYSGNPSSSEKDKYRFLTMDTNVDDKVLQDEEINYILGQYSDHNTRLYYMYEAMANFFARKVSRKLGPQSEFTSDRLAYYTDKANEYKAKKLKTYNVQTVSGSATFDKGMHDNV